MRRGVGVAVGLLLAAESGAWVEAASGWTYEATYDIDPGTHNVTASLAGRLLESITCRGQWLQTTLRATPTTNTSWQVRFHGNPAALQFGWTEQRNGYVNETDYACSAGTHEPLVPADRYFRDAPPWQAGDCGGGLFFTGPFVNGQGPVPCPRVHARMRGQGVWATRATGGVPFTGKISVGINSLSYPWCVDDMVTPGIVYGELALLPALGDLCPVYATLGAPVYAGAVASGPMPGDTVGSILPMGDWRYWTQHEDASVDT